MYIKIFSPLTQKKIALNGCVVPFSAIFVVHFMPPLLMGVIKTKKHKNSAQKFNPKI